MFGSSVFEIAIGIIFVYLALSLISTAANEAIATLINKRGRNLFEGIKNLLNDPSFTGLAQQVYNHGLVDGLSQGASDSSKVNRPPSYMPSKNFSLALLDILSAHGAVAAAGGESLAKAELDEDAYQKKLEEFGGDKTNAAVTEARAVADLSRGILDTTREKAKADFESANKNQGASPSDEQRNVIEQKRLAYFTADAAVKILDARRAAFEAAASPKDAALVKKAADALEESLSIGRSLLAGLPGQLDSVHAAVKRLPDGHTKESLLVLIEKSKREVSEIPAQLLHFQQNIETWFNDSMDRVGGWYKRWTQKIQLILAIMAVLLLNADTVMLAKRFSTDKDLRAAVLREADNSKQMSASEIASKIETLSLPLGWAAEREDSRRFPWLVDMNETHPASAIAGQVILKLIGLLITIAAVSLGAPFWFDTLSKFVNLRGTGTPPGEKKKSA